MAFNPIDIITPITQATEAGSRIHERRQLLPFKEALLQAQSGQSQANLDAFLTEENIKNTARNLVNLEGLVESGASDQEIEMQLRNNIQQAQEGGRDSTDSEFALAALKGQGREGLQRLMQGARIGFERQGALTPAGGVPRRVQSSQAAEGGFQVLYADGSTEFKKMPQDDYEALLKLEQDERDRVMADLEEKENVRDLADLRKEKRKEIQTRAATASRTMPRLEALKLSLQGVQTGKFSEVKKLAAKWIPGINAAKEEELEAMIMNEVLGQAEKMSGSMSDTDIRLLTDSLPGLSNTVEGNLRIIDQMISGSQRSVDEFDQFNKFVKGEGDVLEFLYRPKEDGVAPEGTRIELNGQFFIKRGEEWVPE